MQNEIDINSIKMLAKGDSEYHYRFSLIKNPPKVIYYLGDISILNKPILGIVGPRNPSAYGVQVLDKIFESIPRYDLVTVSGMADGIDSLAHKLSIQNNIPTIAVLGGGLRRYLQSGVRSKIQKIVESGGLVISEFDLDMKPEFFTYPQRNRIIAGLSDVLFVPEAKPESGSLITVDFALQMSRPVYATPNSIFSEHSQGIHTLLGEGKIQVAFDFGFLDKFFGKNSTNKIPEIINYNLSAEEQVVINALDGREQLSLTELSSITNIPSDEIVGIITMLEINKCIYESSPGVYKKL